MTTRDIWNSNDWQARRAQYTGYRQWFDGTKLGAVMQRRDTTTGAKQRIYPLDINMAELACTIHRDLARGMPDQDEPMFVQAVVDRDTDQAEVLEKIINDGVWRPSHGGPIQQEGLLAMMIYGGTVYKLSWEPWDDELPYKMALRLIKNPGHIYPVYDWLNPWKLLECYVGYEIPAASAYAKYGITVSGPTALYMEHWTPTEYRYTVDDVVPTMQYGEEEYRLAGENPFGFVPVFYVPHERTVQELWGDSLIPRQTELIKETNARTADLADIVRKALPGVWCGSDLGNMNVQTVSSDGQVIAKIVNIGRSRPQQGGAASPKLFAAPTPDLPEELARFPKALLDFWMMMARISPAVFGLDDTSSGRITGPAIAQRMWTSIAHAVTTRVNFSDAKNDIDRNIIRALLAKREAIDAAIPEITSIATVGLRQKWPEMIPLDQEVRHREMIERLGQFGISLETYLKEMGIEDVDGEMTRIIKWMKEQAKIEAMAKPKEPNVPGNKPKNQTSQQRPRAE